MEALVLAISLLCGVDDITTPEPQLNECIEYYTACVANSNKKTSEEKIAECRALR